MSIRILKPGLFDTIQDMGRYGYQHLGINPGGVMDTVAASIANMLVANDPSMPVIEMHFPAASFLFEEDCLIALSGGDFGAHINDMAVPINTAIIVSAKSTLSFKRYNSGARIYLSVQSGISADQWLNSFSTNIKLQAGGSMGRRLQKDDTLQLKHTQLPPVVSSSVLVTPITIDATCYYHGDKINCVKGKDYEMLSPKSCEILGNNIFTITRQSDRMGYRLQGESLQLITQQEMISAGVTKGCVQLLPNGQLIILMADYQTTGGYPVVAHICSSHMPALAQMQPGATMSFSFVDIELAHQLFIEQQSSLNAFKETCALQLKKFFS